MFELDDKIVGLDVINTCFACDIKACKGICCVLGDSGAPLQSNEADAIDEVYPIVKEYMTQKGIESVDILGKYTVDSDGDLVTTLVNGNKECVFTIFDNNGIASCAIEKAYFDKKISFRKPISCHLYPIRVKKYQKFDALNYDRWDVCSDAVLKGKIEQIKLYKFLQEALVRAYGQEWYDTLETIIEEYTRTKK